VGFQIMNEFGDAADAGGDGGALQAMARVRRGRRTPSRWHQHQVGQGEGSWTLSCLPMKGCGPARCVRG